MRAAHFARTSPHAAGAPAQVACDHVTTYPKDQYETTHWHTVQTGQKPVSPFVVVGFEAPPSKHKRLATALQRDPLRHKANFYSGHTPTLQRLNHVADLSQMTRVPRTGHHPGGCRASRISNSCSSISHVTRPCYRSDLCRMSALPRRHSFPERSTMQPIQPGISAYETRSSAYPSTQIVCDLAPTLIGVTSKPLRAFHG